MTTTSFIIIVLISIFAGWFLADIVWRFLMSLFHKTTITEITKDNFEEMLYSFEKIDVFMRVKGRPLERNERITQEILDEYCDKFEKDELKGGVVPASLLYKMIKSKRIKPAK